MPSAQNSCITFKKQKNIYCICLLPYHSVSLWFGLVANFQKPKLVLDFPHGQPEKQIPPLGRIRLTRSEMVVKNIS